MGLFSWFAGMRRSFRKSRELQQVSLTLAQRSIDLAHLGRTALEQSAALDRLWSLVREDPALSMILASHAADRDALNEAYRVLCVAGAGQWEHGHWVAASAFAFGYSLDYTLRKLVDDEPDRDAAVDAAYHLVDYFARGGVGSVDGVALRQ